MSEHNKYVLLNCENAKKLIRYTSSINYYLFYDDLVKFKKNKEEIKKKFIKSLVDLIIKEYAKTAMGKQAGDIAKNFLQKGMKMLLEAATNPQKKKTVISTPN